VARRGDALSTRAASEKRRRPSAMTGWIVPSLAYMALLGTLGVTTKLALDHVSWQDVILWTMVAYVVIGIIMLSTGQASLGFGPGTGAAIASAVLASSALIAFYIALGRGDASQVVPFTSAYPVVTLVLSALVLAEKITLLRGLGALVVVIGVVMISLDS
jgi:bacterial/archaeal transporter family protein